MTDRILSQPGLLAQYRQERGWSQAHLAEQSGVSRTEISAIENGRLVPSVAVALRLAAILNESVERIFGGRPVVPADRMAWAAGTPHDGRVWRAMVNGRLLTYPVEATAAGVIPHDGLMTATGLQMVASDARPDRTLVIAGCDPLVGILAHELGERHGVRVVPLLRSSTQALDLLQQGLVHAAGIHLTDRDGRSTNQQTVGARLGPGHLLLHQLRWESGIAVLPERRERSVRALLRANVRWVNREEGSAARRTFDSLLGGARRPKGYNHVVRDHRSVAATVSSGWAEAGVCVRPAAAEVRLGFLTLQQEAYELCVPEAGSDDLRIRALVSTLGSARYRRYVSDVPGCLSSDTGAQHAVS